MYSYCGATEQKRACVSRYDESAWTSHDEARIDGHIASTGVHCTNAHPSLPHQNTKRETSYASKSQVNQSSWNKKVLKFSSENQLNAHNYLFNSGITRSLSHGGQNLTAGSPLANTQKKLGNISESGCRGWLH